jgi:hypothetical protein
MSDEQGVQPMTDEVSAASPVVAPKASGLKGFMSTTLGKIVVIGLAVGVLVTILAVVAVIVLGGLGMSLLGQVAEKGSGTPAVAPGPPAAQPATETVPPVATVENREVFTPRDPFMRVIMPASALGSDAANDANTLTLLEIIEENGETMAVLQLGATKHTLMAGDVIPSTPWMVVSIGSTSVVMLYGDTQITLTIGQGISMK